MRRQVVHNRAFTLIEVMLATTIGAFVTLVAVGALTTVSRCVESVQRISDQDSDDQAVVRLMRRDLSNVYRGADLRWTKLVGQDGTSLGAEGQSSLTFYSLWPGQVRQGQPEGDVVEIEYCIRQSEKGTFLMRRIWPNPDPQRKQGGGLLSVLSDRVLRFQVRYYDGKKWSGQWSREQKKLPKLVEVSLLMGSREKKKEQPHLESFCVALTRADGSQAVRSVLQPQGSGRGQRGKGS